MKSFSDFQATCKEREQPLSDTYGMNRECLLMAGPAECNVRDCPKYKPPLRLCCENCSDKAAGDCFGCMVGRHNCVEPVKECLEEDEKTCQ